MIQETNGKELRVKKLSDYPIVLDLALATDLAVSLYPEKYPNAEKARNIIRIQASNGRIPGANSIQLAGRERAIWQYDRDKLASWLADPNAHKSGRPRKAK